MASTKIRITLKNVRISYANIFEAKAYNDGPAKFSASFLISKERTDQLEMIQKNIMDVIKMHWPQNAPKIPRDKQPLKDGDDKEWEGYAGNMFISASNMLQPRIIDLDGTNLLARTLDSNPGDKPQSGDYVNAVIDLVVQDNSFGKRVNAYLMGVQYVSQGARFGGGADDSMFADTIVAKSPEVLKKEKQDEAEEGWALFGDE